jgi:electron-transferring-flavoprotein dehydrogenase
VSLSHAPASGGGGLEPARPRIDADLVCVGFGPAMGGFLTTLTQALTREDGSSGIASGVAPGLPLQVLCYERASDLAFGVSGAATRAQAIRASIPDLDPSQIPMAAAVSSERVVYLLDPVGASRRSRTLRTADALIRASRRILPFERDALELPYVPPFLRKEGGLVLSIGQLNQWVAQQLMASAVVQVWPSAPVARALVEGGRVVGVRLLDQGVDRLGKPAAGFAPGMDVHAALTVIGDGPVGAISRQLDEELGVPEGHRQEDWAVGMKIVVDLPSGSGLREGTVIHTFGYPEPEIFGFLYVHPGNVASLGIFVPSWFESPVRTAYRYLQHWMLHPYLWRHLDGGTLRSWGAKTLGESGRRAEPHLVGDGFARVGEGSGSTNVLTGSGIDEAWETGALLARAVLELLGEGAPFTRGNLERTYVARRRASRIEREGKVAERARDGFRLGFVAGLVGMALAGFTRGGLSFPDWMARRRARLPSLEEYFRDRIPGGEIQRIRQECRERDVSVHGALMDRCGWPAIPLDGKLLLSHQDALLLGGKVQAPAGLADHVVFLYPELCERCDSRVCVEICSGQAITAGPGGLPEFEREKCVHCGACAWSCAMPLPDNPARTNIGFHASAGGLHSAEN